LAKCSADDHKTSDAATTDAFLKAQRFVRTMGSIAKRYHYAPTSRLGDALNTHFRKSDARKRSPNLTDGSRLSGRKMLARKGIPDASIAVIADTFVQEQAECRSACSNGRCVKKRDLADCRASFAKAGW
jgi:hypothetical protein